MGIVLYGTENRGRHSAFDQILQFGAIKTDYELNLIDRLGNCANSCACLTHVWREFW